MFGSTDVSVLVVAGFVDVDVDRGAFSHFDLLRGAELDRHFVF